MRQAGVLLAVLGLAVACTGPDGASVPTETSPAGDSRTTAPVAEGGDGYTVCWSAAPSGGGGGPLFVDRTSDLGLVEPLTGMRGHAAAWGDVDGDGLVDLIFGTFATARTDVYLQRGAQGPAPDRLFDGTGDGFAQVQGFPEQFGRTSGAAFADLDGDGDLDLVLSRNVAGRTPGDATVVMQNDDGSFSIVDSGIGADTPGRSVGVLDYDEDGLLDLVILEDHYTGGSSQVFHNEGGLVFVDATQAAGLPGDVHGLGLATGDLDLDGHTDLFVAGSNRLFLGTGSGFDELAGAVDAWEAFGPEDDVSGAAIADVNRDGWLDLVVGHHYNSTVDRDTEVPVRLYLNRTELGGELVLEDVTEQAGLAGMPTKAPHVELADVDNDGWPDIVTSASAADGTLPAVILHTGLEGDVPRFSMPSGLGSDQYWVTAPTADVDRDGDLDLLAVEWDPGLPSILFSNDGAGGHWLEVVVDDGYGGVGARVDVYREGGSGDPEMLLGSREITVTVGYTAGVEAVAHFGLGDVDLVDVVITPHGAAPIEVDSVRSDARISSGPEC